MFWGVMERGTGRLDLPLGQQAKVMGGLLFPREFMSMAAYYMSSRKIIYGPQAQKDGSDCFRQEWHQMTKEGRTKERARNNWKATTRARDSCVLYGKAFPPSPLV